MAAIAEDNFKPGTLIKIKNIQSRPELNGKSGVVDGKQKDNGRYPIMCDGEKVFSLKDDCMEVFHQCPTEKRPFENGMLSVIWPHVKGVATPTVEWLHDDNFGTNFNLLGENWDKMSSSGKEFVGRLKRMMNWTDLHCINYDSVSVFFNGCSNQRVKMCLKFHLKP